jgi:hypothetical protein
VGFRKVNGTSTTNNTSRAGYLGFRVKLKVPWQQKKLNLNTLIIRVKIQKRMIKSLNQGT